jgi:hypothetical protein
MSTTVPTGWCQVSAAHHVSTRAEACVALPKQAKWPALVVVPQIASTEFGVGAMTSLATDSTEQDSGIVAATLLHRFRIDDDVSAGYRGAGGIRWLICKVDDGRRRG